MQAAKPNERVGDLMGYSTLEHRKIQGYASLAARSAEALRMATQDGDYRGLEHLYSERVNW